MRIREKVKAILTLYPKAKRMEISSPYISIYEEGFLLTHINVELFPSLCLGQTIQFADCKSIIEEYEKTRIKNEFAKKYCK